MPLTHVNNEDAIDELLDDPGIWAIVGLSTNEERTAASVATWLKHEMGKGIIPIHPDAPIVDGDQGYASLADIPDGTDLRVVDCFVNSENVGAIVDEAIAQKERLHINAVWLQKGVVDQEAAQRAEEAGLTVVMDTCPKIEARLRAGRGSGR